MVNQVARAPVEPVFEHEETGVAAHNRRQGQEGPSLGEAVRHAHEHREPREPNHGWEGDDEHEDEEDERPRGAMVVEVVGDVDEEFYDVDVEKYHEDPGDGGEGE